MVGKEGLGGKECGHVSSKITLYISIFAKN
jgi:hypothetical protein